jgi:hypothetical protein
MKQKQLIKKCENYLGDRGIVDDVKRCAEYKDLWFIVFKHNPEEVEISFKSMCYECYDDIPINKMIWNKSNYEKVRKQLNN